MPMPLKVAASSRRNSSSPSLIGFLSMMSISERMDMTEQGSSETCLVEDMGGADRAFELEGCVYKEKLEVF